MSELLGTRSQRAVRPPAGLGERLRRLRIAAGLTQSELAGDRFSKEYVSQIERGKTRPTAETIEWIARRLGTDPGFLIDGVSADERGRVEAALARAEALVEAGEDEEALAEFDGVQGAVRATGIPELELRALAGHSWPLIRRGRIREAIDLLERARALAERPSSSDLDRAEVLFRLGVCRYKLSSVSTALGLLNEALALAERSDLPSDPLRVRILDWRSRCYRLQRDFEAAREDAERAVELAQAMGDARALALAYFEASIVAEREGHWLLARSYAERAKARFEELADQRYLGRILNNLGGLSFLLGKPEQAVGLLKQAFKVALDTGHEADAAQAVSSLAQVHLRTGELAEAERQARHALHLLEGRVDFLEEIGNAQLVLGRSLLEQGRLDEAELAIGTAESSFDQLSSASHRAAAWMARADLASRRGDDRAAATLYRRAAEALQDFRF